MLYFEDFMEAIENLPAELTESLATVRQLDVQSENLIHTVHEAHKRLFDNCKHDRLSKMMVSVEHAEIVKNYEKASALAREKCKLVDKLYTTYRILMRKLDAELEKFRLELEADNSGITEQIEHKTEMLLEKSSSAVKAEKRRQGFRFQRGSNFKTPFLIHRKIIGHACRTALRSSNVRPFSHTHKLDGFRNGLMHGRVGHGVKHGVHMRDPSMTQAGLESVDDHGRFCLLQPRALSDVDTPDSDDAYDSKSGVTAYPTSRSEFNPTSESDFGAALEDPTVEIPTSLSGPSASPLTPKLSPFFTFPTSNLINCEQNVLSANRYHQTRLIGSQGSLAAVSSSTTDHGEVTAVNNPIGCSTSAGYPGEHRLYSAQSTSPIPPSTPTDSSSRQSRIHSTSRDRRVRNPPKRAGAIDGDTAASLVSSSSCSGRTASSSSRSLSLFMPSSTGGVAFDDSAIDQIGSETVGMLGNFLEADGSSHTAGGEHSIKFDSHSDLAMLAGGVCKGAEMDDVDQEEEEDQKRYCLCRDVSYGDMIACDAPNCPFEWFHYHCVNLTVAPKGNWFCPNCIKNCIASKNKKRLSRR